MGLFSGGNSKSTSNYTQNTNIKDERQAFNNDGDVWNAKGNLTLTDNGAIASAFDFGNNTLNKSLGFVDGAFGKVVDSFGTVQQGAFDTVKNATASNAATFDKASQLVAQSTNAAAASMGLVKIFVAGLAIVSIAALFFSRGKK